MEEDLFSVLKMRIINFHIQEISQKINGNRITTMTRIKLMVQDLLIIYQSFQTILKIKNQTLRNKKQLTNLRVKLKKCSLKLV